MSTETPGSRLRVGLWQCAPTPRDREANLRRLDAVAAGAAEQGVGLVITPELTLTGYDIGDLTGLLRDDDIERLASIAARHGVALVVGLATASPTDAGTVHNSAVLIDRTGEVLTTYHKAHLYGTLDGRFVAGTTPFALAELDGIRVATMICYDVEFPEAVRAAALSGAHLVAVPTANMHPFTIVCESVVPVRAWENQVYVAYANHCGAEADTAYVGRSVVVAPDGQPIATGEPEGEQLVVADIDTSLVDSGRQSNPYLADRRPDVYGGSLA